ncbi:influenza virus NS1A-binding protein homolog isoform X2 [Condylostylus longicornis]|uniref:influenza virus NS1A-binding protein homolog isoform X2 n=1 Tax=Condylostylus longicornis TaxID=2530218 RepID=UPI00244DCF9F|nr:influenza virus NS1A-binding protein homolog isoform X2 [Condylostylus longicornis]
MKFENSKEPSIESETYETCEDAGLLKFIDDEMKASFLQSLHTMRKHRLFCDVVLNVGNSDIHAHKNVLACVSPYFMELFSTDQDQKNGHSEDIPSFRLNGNITKHALQILVDYAYTGKLEVPDVLVKDVYLAAWKLRMERCFKQCAQHLISELSPDTCIEIRSLPGIDKNTSFVNQVDAFINSEFAAVSETAGFLQLSCVQIDVLYQTKQEMSLVTHNMLSRLVLDWIKRQLVDESLSDSQLLERSHLLYLALDNSLQDCSDLPPGQESESDIVQDYKRMVLKCPNNIKQRRKQLGAPVKPRVLIYSRDLGEDDNQSETDWNLISSSKCGENAFIAVAAINGRLMRLSVKLRLNNVPPSPLNGANVVNNQPAEGQTSTQSTTQSLPSANVSVASTGLGSTTASTNGSSVDASVEGSRNASNRNSSELELFCEVATMSGPKCGLGVADFNGKLWVCGGYDRAECLKKVESYCPETNTWTHESNMNEARGRVQVAVLNNTVYAVGGSNGTTELDTVECLKFGEQKWQKRKRLPLARSNAGTCALNSKIYCIGGWNGQIGIKQCDVYSPENDQWNQIAPLNTGRYQAGVTAHNGKLWAVGGSDAWNCLSSVESYDPDQDVWIYASPLLTPRRGCGVAEFQNKLYAVGGSDGTQSLSSTEVYDENTKSWVVGPPLITPRSNVSVVVVQDKLYAIGGFSGKTFLNTIEYLDPVTNEWTSFVPHQHDAEKIRKVILGQENLAGSENENNDEENDIRKPPTEFTHKNSLETLDEVQKIIASIKLQNHNNKSDEDENGVEEQHHQQNGTHKSNNGNVSNSDENSSTFNELNQQPTKSSSSLNTTTS